MSPLQSPRNAACTRSSKLVGHDENRDYSGSTSSSWKEIFAVDHGSVPQLGVNFVRAAKDVATVKYSLANTRLHGLAGDGPVQHATLTLGQDLRNLGLGAVVWDCVSPRQNSCQVFKSTGANCLMDIRLASYANTNILVVVCCCFRTRTDTYHHASRERAGRVEQVEAALVSCH